MTNFTRATLASAGRPISCRRVSVRPSVCQKSCSTETAKRTGSRKQCHTIDRDSSFLVPKKYRQNSNAVTPPQRRRQMQVR